jgi:hypothetical protein
MKEKVQKILSRLDLTKDIDPFNKKLMNDCRDMIDQLQTEVERLQYHNNNLMNVIYQNQSALESIDEPTGE